MQNTNQKMALTIDEVVHRSGLGRDTVYKAIRCGHLEAKKYGRRTLIQTEALRPFLDRLPSLELAADGFSS